MWCLSLSDFFVIRHRTYLVFDFCKYELVTKYSKSPILCFRKNIFVVTCSFATLPDMYLCILYASAQKYQWWQQIILIWDLIMNSNLSHTCFENWMHTSTAVSKFFILSSILCTVTQYTSSVLQLHCFLCIFLEKSQYHILKMHKILW